MRKILLLVIGGMLLTNSYAQNIDRSQAPKPGPAPVIKLEDPVIYTLENGIKVLVVENHKVPSVSASYYIYTGPVKEGEKAGVMGLMGGMLNQGTTTMDKAAFDEAVEQDGTNLSLNSQGGSVSALDRYFDKGLMLMAQALQHPAFKEGDFDKLKTQEVNGLKADDKSVATVASNVTGALLYGKNSPLGEFETEKTVAAISLSDVKNMYQKYITPSNGYLTIVGDIKPEEAKKLAEKYFGDWKGENITLPTLADAANPAKTEIDVVDMPNAVQSVINVTNLVTLPLDSKDYFAVLLANQILGGGADAYLFKDIREKHAYTYGAYSSISGGNYQTSFRASASVRNAVTDSAVTLFFNNIKRIRTESVTEELLNNVKAEYNGNFAIGTENPSRIAVFARNILIYQLPKDYYRTYLQKINAVTPADVMRAAKEYFNYDNSRVVVTGKAEDILSGLKKMGYAVKVYDKEANPITETANKPVELNANEIINNYIHAIGGAENLKKVNAILINGTMGVQGMSIPFVEKRMSPNKESIVMSMNGNEISKTVFDGAKGYQKQMGNTMELTKDQLAKYTDQKCLFSQLAYNDGTYKLDVKGMGKVNGSDAYKVDVTGPSGKTSTEFYDVKTGYLVQVAMQTEAKGQQVSVVSTFSDYKKVGDIYLPFLQSIAITTAQGGQNLEMKTIDTKINEGVTDTDFE
ncbi:insulinase family protein [Arachidicoccus soli]|uniref:Insulinase family protein n=1 Tax=Arachidicoccus soli TaxID=2341117 RepID=A0A386HQI6_9BACT|nr:insulinase family protein [Arachidicoccus soli]AYD47919.1 insulinase family protein [Arachidicoccus soli]